MPRRTGRRSPRTTTSATTARPSTPSCAGSARPRAARTTPPTAPGSAAGRTCAPAWRRCRYPGRTARLRPGLRGGVLGHHQQAGLVRVRVGAARPGLAARLPRAAVPRRGRGVLLRHCHRPGLPRAVRLEPGTVTTVTIFDIPVKTLDGEDSSLGATAPGAALLVVN